MACMDSTGTDTYWKHVKYPHEKSAFGTNWKVNRLCSVADEYIAAVTSNEVLFFDAYGEHKGTISLAHLGRVVNIETGLHSFVKPDGTHCLVLLHRKQGDLWKLHISIYERK